MAEIEYFYAAHSVYAYIGMPKFREIAKAAGRDIVHKPYDLTRGIAAAGSTPTRDRTTAHRAYFFGREIKRWAEQRGLEIYDGMPPTHRNDITLANCSLIAATDTSAGADDLAEAYHTAHWIDGADLSDADTLAKLAASVGQDGQALLTAAATQSIQDRYAANTEEAIARSVFGSPTYFVDGDMFYGQDHLELVERACRQPYAGEWPPAA